MTIDYEKQGNVGIITINRPDARNAVNSEVANGIEAALELAYAERPRRDAVVAEATATLQQARQFLIDKDLITVPSDPVSSTPAHQSIISSACLRSIIFSASMKPTPSWSISGLPNASRRLA